MIEKYLKHKELRNEKGIPPLPLNADNTVELCNLLESPVDEQKDFLINLFTERIAPGVDPAAKVKAEFLNDILKGKKSSPLISKDYAVEILGTAYRLPFG